MDTSKPISTSNATYANHAKRIWFSEGDSANAINSQHAEILGKVHAKMHLITQT